LDETIVEEDFLGTGIDEIEQRVTFRMSHHPRVSQEDSAVLTEKNAAGGQATMILIDVLQVEEPLHAGLQNALQLIFAEPATLYLARNALLLEGLEWFFKDKKENFGRATGTFLLFDVCASKAHEEGRRIEYFMVDKPLHSLDLVCSTTCVFLANVLTLSNSRHQFQQFVILVAVDELVPVAPAELLPGLKHSHIIY
jgi:hypothetical protein